MKAVGGGLEAAAGAAVSFVPVPGARVLGFFLVAHGADTAAAGVRQAASGDETRTLFSQSVSKGAELLGADKEAAYQWGEGADMAAGMVGPAFAEHALTSPNFARSLLPRSSNAEIPRAEPTPDPAQWQTPVNGDVPNVKPAETPAPPASAAPQADVIDLAKRRAEKLAAGRAKVVEQRGKVAVGAEDHPTVAAYSDEEIAHSRQELESRHVSDDTYDPSRYERLDTAPQRLSEYNPWRGDSNLLGQRLESEANLPKPGEGYEAHHIVPANEPAAQELRNFLRERGWKDINDADNGVWLQRENRGGNVDAAYKHEFTFDRNYYNREYFHRIEDILMRDPNITPAGIRFKLRQIRSFLMKGQLPPENL